MLAVSFIVVQATKILQVLRHTCFQLDNTAWFIPSGASYVKTMALFLALIFQRKILYVTV